MNREPQVFAPDRAVCGEAPVWDGSKNRLLWVDNERALLCIRELDGTSTEVVELPTRALGLALNDDGRLVIAGPEGIALRASDGAMSEVLANADGDYVFNDVLAAPSGGLYAGSFFWGESGKERPGALYYIAPDGAAETVDEEISLSNGLALSPDDRTLYFSDTSERAIYAYDVDTRTGIPSNRRVFARFAREDGIPDGLAVDSEGGLWCALWYGGRVIRFLPDGTEAGGVEIPAAQVSSVAFGGADLDVLFVTSGDEYWPSELEPEGFDSTAEMGGPVFMVHAGVGGVPQHVCAFRP